MEVLLSFRPDFHVRILNESSLVIFSDESQVLFQSEAYVAIAKELIEGPKSFSYLINKLHPSFEVELIKKAINRLLEKFVVSNRPLSFSTKTTAFWYLNDVDPVLLEKRQADCKISFNHFGKTNDASINKFSDILHDLGFSICDEGDFTIAIVDNYLGNNLATFNIEAKKNNITWMPIKFGGKNLWLGPIFGDKNPKCWGCLEHSLKENRRVQVDIFGTSSNNLGISEKAHCNAIEEIAYNLCGLQMAKWFVKQSEHTLLDNLLMVDPVNLEHRLHRVELISCENCQKQSIQKTELENHLNKSPKNYKDLNGSRSCTPEETLEILKDIVSPITGIVSSFRLRRTNNDYIVYSVRNLPLFSSLSTSQKHFFRVPDVTVGKGRTKTQAKIGCFAESLERYNNTYFSQPSVYCSYNQIQYKTYHPEELLLFSENQYDQREIINSNNGPFNRIPKKYDGSKIRWTKAYSLNNEEHCYLPSSYCYLNYPFDNEVVFCPGDTNGCASGNTIEESLFYGMLELIERDAVALWWYNRVQFSSIDINSLNNNYISRLSLSLSKKGRNFHLIDITSDLKVPTFVAVSWDKNGNQIYFGTSAHLDPITAMIRATHELNQIMTRKVNPGEDNLQNVHENEKDLVRWIKNENIANHPYLKPVKEVDYSSMNYETAETSDFMEDINYLVKVMSAKGLSVYWINLSYVKIPFFTVRVIIPGLRHCWKRLGPGRLYDAPVSLKLLSAPLREEEMNNIPFFL